MTTEPPPPSTPPLKPAPPTPVPKHNPETLFRSETMHLYQIIVRNEAAYDCVAELGKVGAVQFRDLNPDVTTFQRKFVNEVRRCNDMERQLRFLRKEIIKDGISLEDDNAEVTEAPHSRELNRLETILEKLESEVIEANQSVVKLKQNWMELTEMRYMLHIAHSFFDDRNAHLSDSTTKAVLGGETGAAHHDRKLRFVTGVIQRDKLLNFERMLWRVCRGNNLLRTAPITEKLEDPATGALVLKDVIIIFYHGDQLKDRIRRTCEGFRATIYNCPDTSSERQDMSLALRNQLEDLAVVLAQSQKHRNRVLSAAARNLELWSSKVYKAKTIYHHLNMFQSDMTHMCLVAEGWCPKQDVPEIRQALEVGTVKSGASVPSIFNRIRTKEIPPTFNRTNKFTNAFQVLIDAYGVASYREINPAPYTIVTFPFLFAIMFGDVLHGLIMTLFALWMVRSEKKIEASKPTNEIWRIFFGGRYIILLMGLFSIYCGSVYNDIGGKAANVFGSSWTINYNLSTVVGNKVLELDPKYDYTQSAYPFGIDPVWGLAKLNRIIFMNGIKMKFAIIIGVIHMIFGVTMSLFNNIYFMDSTSIVTGFVPQLIFLVALFFYLVVLMFMKWFKYSAAEDRVRFTPGCAPSILITFINMMMLKKAANVEPDCSEYMYNGQDSVQKCLLISAVLCIPVMMLGKPVWAQHQRMLKRREARHQRLLNKGATTTDTTEHEHEEDISELYIHQAIHTIEYVLGSVSHTASYLRLWALSLAHGQLAEVLWEMILHKGIAAGNNHYGVLVLFVIFAFWAVLSIAILVLMEGLSAFLHTLRLHWVEFQSKFYMGTGYAFVPYRLHERDPHVAD